MVVVIKVYKNTKMTTIMRHYKRITQCVATTLPKAIKTCLWMLKITLPISLLVRLMQYYGVMDVIGTAMSSLFPLLGLPAESAVVFFTSCCLPIYAPIALMATIDLTIRQATILSLMCLVSHNLPVECAIAKKTGSSFATIFLLRVCSSIILATVANVLLPEDARIFTLTKGCIDCSNLYDVISVWLVASLNLAKTLGFIVTSLLLIQSLLEEYGVIRYMCHVITPLMNIMGLSSNASFLWLIGNVVGLSYGSAIMINMVSEGQIEKYEADLANRHLAISHSLLEDTVLFASLGVCAWWLLLFRIPLAIIAVWAKRLSDKYMVTNQLIILRNHQPIVKHAANR